PSAWNVDAGRLRQTTAIRGSDSASKQGTNALAGSIEWENYRASVVVRFVSGGALGLLCRATSNGHYRFAIDADDNTLYLLKRVGSAYTTLYSQSFTPAA